MASKAFTREAASIIITALKSGAKRSAAAKQAGVTPSTLSKWIQQGTLEDNTPLALFASDVFKAEALDENTLLTDLKKTVFTDMGTANPTAIMFILKSRYGWGQNAIDNLIDYLVEKLTPTHPDLLAEILNDINKGVLD